MLDNGRPSKILSFQGFNGFSARPSPPVEVILLIDTLNLPARLASEEREGVKGFLRQNGGHLAQQVSIFELAATGLWTVGQPSADGNALASDLDHSREALVVRSAGADVPDGPRFKGPPTFGALRALGQIATAERQQPGRKLLVWVGPGSGIGSGAYGESTVSKEDTFSAVCWFSTLLREARVVLYSLSVGETDPSRLYVSYLPGVSSARQANAMNLYRKVLAVQSGGRVLNESSDIVRQIASCVREASTFYTLSFDPPPAAEPNEYHALTVRIGTPGLTAHTNTGYYDQPYYSDQPDPALRRMSAEELEQLLGTLRGESDGKVSRQLSRVVLTDRMSTARLAYWRASLHGKDSRQQLTAVADASAFLDPPRSEIAADPPPDAAELQRILLLAADYVKNAIPKLPDFYARRTTIRYEDSPAFHAGSANMNYQPLHAAQSARVTVLYRNGAEVVDSAKHKKGNAKDRYLITYGTFGPILGLVHGVLADPNNLTWSRWEQDAGGRRAVFRYAVPLNKSQYQVFGCCLPDGDGTEGFQMRAVYRGEISLDPTTGAILRLAAEADLKGFVPLLRADVMVEYGPVDIGGKNFICPTRSVSVMRSRSVILLQEWDEGFRTYGPYATTMNDISFDSYHMFRADSRMLTDFKRAADQKSAEPEAPQSPAEVPPMPQ